MEDKVCKGKKVADSGYRVLELLKLLIERPVTNDEIIKTFEKDESTKNVYNKETILKYTNTLKLAGFDIEKIDNRLCLQNLAKKISVSRENLETYKFLKDYSQILGSVNAGISFYRLFELFEKSFDEETRMAFVAVKPGFYIDKLNLIKNANLVNRFAKYCKAEDRLKITYHDTYSGKIEKYNVEPRSIVFNKENAFLVTYLYKENEYKKFLLENITNVESCHQKANTASTSKYITYRLKNRLAKSYGERENEKVLSEEARSKVISNRNEDKNTLFCRLLRYQSNCEILYPEKIRNEFVDFVDKILAQYETTENGL